VEHLAAEYNGPVTVLLADAEVPARAELVAWRGEPAAVDEDGTVVFDLDPPSSPRWAGAVSLAPGSIAPVQVPSGTVRLRFPDGRLAEGELESVAWTEDEVLEIAVVGQGAAPF
jgi:hypothetical protein